MRDADDLLAPAVRETVAALDPPAEDAALVALARTLAASIDEMAPAVRAAMIGQVSGQLMRALKDLDDRARRRRTASKTGRPNRVAQLRAAHVAATTKRKRAG